MTKQNLPGEKPGPAGAAPQTTNGSQSREEGAMPSVPGGRWGMEGERPAPPPANVPRMYEINTAINNESVELSYITQVSADQEARNLTIDARYDDGIAEEVIRMGTAYPGSVPPGTDIADLERQREELAPWQTLETAHAIAQKDTRRTRQVRTDYLWIKILTLVTAMVEKANQETATGSTETVGRAATAVLLNLQARIQQKSQNVAKNLKNAEARGQKGIEDILVRLSAAEAALSDRDKVIADLKRQILTGATPPVVSPSTPIPTHRSPAPASSNRRNPAR